MAKTKAKASKPGTYTKAIAGSLAGVATAVSAALLDGHIDGGEWAVIGAALIGAFGVVFKATNND